MLSVGQQLRDQRLRLGLKLEEISAKSRISLKTLQAIENDDLASVSSPFLYKSFARQFAEHLKLDFEQLAPALASAALSMPQPRLPGVGDFVKTNVAPLPMKRQRCGNFRWLSSFASLAVVVVACSSFYGLWQNSRSAWLADLIALVHPSANSPTQSKPAAAALSSIVPTLATPAVPEEHRVPRPSVESNTAQKKTDNIAEAGTDQDSSAGYHIELSAIEPTWVSIIEDGKQTFNGMLDPEETKILEGHDSARLRTGNAGGISCVFNGKSIGPLGPRGQVRTVVFTASNYEVLDAAPHIALTNFPAIIE